MAIVSVILGNFAQGLGVLLLLAAVYMAGGLSKKVREHDDITHQHSGTDFGPRPLTDHITGAFPWHC